MDATRLLTSAVEPALYWLRQFQIVPTDDVRTILIAIAHQESECAKRLQLLQGPARGFWQFERSGVAGVLSHPASSAILKAYCQELSLPHRVADVHEAIAFNDELAAIVARLLIYSDRWPVPSEIDAAWELYLRTWRPGFPRPAEWARSWAIGRRAVFATEQTRRKMLAAMA